MTINRILSERLTGRHLIVSFTWMLLILPVSCDTFLDLDLPKERITRDQVFRDDVTATSAVAGLYANLAASTNSFAGGSYNSVAALAGLSSDELTNYSERPDLADFAQNTLVPDHRHVQSLWETMYKAIYEANSIIEGLQNSTTISITTKRQLTGEALFIRAFTHFYLVNLFGDVPLVTTTAYHENENMPRTSRTNVYDQVIKDLTIAQESLADDYVTEERVRVNKAAAAALLARVYLFREEWAKAERQATTIIEATDRYTLVNLTDVFKSNSKEAIWQLKPDLPGINTQEAIYFFVYNPPYYTMTERLVNAFEPNDNRFKNWVGILDVDGTPIHYPYKYKAVSETPPVESSMVLRLAEMYLIRAEARAKQDNISGAIEDLDVIRTRAGLQSITELHPTIDQTTLLLAIEQEKRIELFAEWGHRWLDLKRTHRATSVLGTIKPEFTSDGELYPIPQTEFNKNPNLGAQNPGY